jgi:hypothetical protein
MSDNQNITTAEATTWVERNCHDTEVCKRLRSRAVARQLYIHIKTLEQQNSLLRRTLQHVKSEANVIDFGTGRE